MTILRSPATTHGQGRVTVSRFAYIPPNWFAAVMGTGIVSVAAHAVGGLEFGGHPLGGGASVLAGSAVAFWLLACVIFVIVVAATVAHWCAHPEAARAHHTHPVIAHFYGAVPMATLTVGTSTLVAGSAVIGHGAAVAVDVVCFTVGTLGGVATAILIPMHLLIGRSETRGGAYGGWLMPVVAPMVSASAAAVLAGSLGSMGVRRIVLVVGAASFVFSLLLAAPIIVAAVRRLVRTGRGPDVLAPTWWIVLGPLGQSVTAACLLAVAAGGVTDESTARLLHEIALGYAIPVWVAAVCWIVVAGIITTRAVLAGLPFGLTWWSFTFPIGTFVTGSAALVANGGGVGFTLAAVVGFVLLLGAWLIVAARTVIGVVDGVVLKPPASPAPHMAR